MALTAVWCTVGFPRRTEGGANRHESVVFSTKWFWLQSGALLLPRRTDGGGNRNESVASLPKWLWLESGELLGSGRPAIAKTLPYSAAQTCESKLFALRGTRRGVLKA